MEVVTILSPKPNDVIVVHFDRKPNQGDIQALATRFPKHNIIACEAATRITAEDRARLIARLQAGGDL